MRKRVGLSVFFYGNEIPGDLESVRIMEDVHERPFLFWSGSHFVRILALFLVP
jgi:hypothetical protein